MLKRGGERRENQARARDLPRFDYRGIKSTGDKEIRAAPFAAQAEAGNVRLVAGPWNRAFLDELTSFPHGAHDDQVDMCSGGFTALQKLLARSQQRVRVYEG